MPSDRARNSYDPRRMYRSSVAQQGRVTLEADHNEAERIRLDEARSALVDVVGPSGTPDDGFKITVPSPNGADFDFAIAAGTLYVGGARLQSTDRAQSYLGQRGAEWLDYPARWAGSSPLGDPSAGGHELVYLAVTEQEVSAVEDPALREIALGGPDTTARTRMLQRVERIATNANACGGALAEAATTLGFTTDPAEQGKAAQLDSATMRLVSTMQLKAGFVALGAAADPCEPLAQAGFLGAENQLIRVQVAAETAKFVWGYDNASFLYRVSVDKDARKSIKLAAAPVDNFHHPREGQWVELLAPAVKLDAAVQPEDTAYVAAAIGLLFEVDSFDASDRGVIKLKQELPHALFDAPPAQLFLRVWENRQDFAADDHTAIQLMDAGDVGTGVSIWTTPGPRIAGDHWMIGVRPSAPQSIFPARLTDFQPPDGPSRWLVPLAVIAWTNAVTATVSDCRLKFHNLVTPDEGGCDLEFHNRHLHGWGVVCGLQVHCVPVKYAAEHNFNGAHEAVVVNNGYAIHPSGADIRLSSTTSDPFTPLALGDLAVSEHVLTRDQQGRISDGAVSLWIDKDASLHVEAYDPTHQQGLQDLLQGTLLFEIYEDCLRKVVDYVQSQLAVPKNAGPDTPEHRRRIALLNLFYQLANQKTGEHVFLSGSAAAMEHAYLRDFYEGLKGLLEQKTFCALFDDVVYPAHDIFLGNERHPQTIFGSSNHAKLKVHPRLPFAYSFGADGKIAVYDLAAGVLKGVDEFPVAGADIQDIAFAPQDDKEGYVIAWTGASHSSSAFHVVKVEDGRLVFGGFAVEYPNLRLCMLAIGDDRHGSVYATARGVGLFQLVAGRGNLIEVRSFKASGHLVAGRIRGRLALYAGEHATDPNPVAFTRVRAIFLEPGGFEGSSAARELRLLLASSAEAQLSGHDDLTVIPTLANPQEDDDVYAIIDGQAGRKTLLTWTLADNDFEQLEQLEPKLAVDLGPSAASRIAYSKQGWAMVTYEDDALGRVYKRGSNALEPELVHPLQIAPVAIATDTAGVFYVLEYVSGTLTIVPAADDAKSVVDLHKLAQYRHDSLAAYMKIIGRVMQFLKDCFCDHLLVKCPTGQGKVYLSDISFKGGEVYQICNFHRRKYVHTFPTVEYWLSLVPLIPLLKYAVEKACCSVIADVFEKLTPPPPADNKDTSDQLSMVKLRYGVEYAKRSDLPTQLGLRAKQVFAGLALGKSSLYDTLSNPSPGQPDTPIDTSELVDKTPEAAKAAAKARGLNVRNVEVSDDTSSAVLSMITAKPPERGTEVDLVVNSRGRVIGWKPAVETPAIAPPAPPVAQPAINEVESLRRELSDMKEAHIRQTEALDHAQAQLRDVVEKMTRMTERIDGLHR